MIILNDVKGRSYKSMFGFLQDNKPEYRFKKGWQIDNLPNIILQRDDTNEVFYSGGLAECVNKYWASYTTILVFPKFSAYPVIFHKEQLHACDFDIWIKNIDPDKEVWLSTKTSGECNAPGKDESEQGLWGIRRASFSPWSGNKESLINSRLDLIDYLDKVNK